MVKQDVPKSFDVMLYPDLEDNGGFYPPLDIAELMARADELQESEELDEFSSGVLFAVEHLMTVPTVGFVKECTYLLEDILAPHSNRPMEEPEEEEEKEIPTNVCEILPREKSLTIIPDKEKDMAAQNPNSITINGVFIRDKKSPSTSELDAWYKAKKGLHIDKWDTLMYAAKREAYTKHEEHIFGKKEEKKSFFAAPERDFTDEEMLEMLHTKEDDILEGLVEPEVEDPIVTKEVVVG